MRKGPPGGSEGRRRGIRRSLRLYRALLYLLPGRLRRRFGDDMVEVFAHRLEGARGRRAKGAVWMRAVVDVGFEAARERVRWVFVWGRRREGRNGMGSWMRDLGHAGRSLRTSPLFAVVAVITIALGIGASTATFSIVDGVLLKPLPYHDPDRLVAIWPEQNFNGAMVRELLAMAPALESGSGVSGWTFTLTGAGDPQEVPGSRVSVDHFRVLGVAPLLGRDFDPDEGEPGNDEVVILSHAFWVRAFGADPAVVGRAIELGTNDHPTHTVVGVMPPDFRPVTGSPDVWVPLSIAPGVSMSEDDTWYVNHRIARLAPGATLEQAEAQVRAFAERIRQDLPRIVSEEDARAADVERLQHYAAGSVGPVLWAALGAVGLVLLMACANVANLLLARGESRSKDLAVRVALGAARERVVRLLMTESTVLGLAGGGLGVLLSFLLLRGILALAPAGFPRLDEIGVDGRVLAFAVLATMASIWIAGLVPALRISRVDPAAAMGGASRGSASRRSSRLTRTLVGVEVALAVVVVVGSGLMLRSLHRMTTEDTGLVSDGVLVFSANPPSGRYPDGAAFHGYYARILEQVRALPQVEQASAIHLLPGTRDNWSFPTFMEDVDIPDGEPVPSVNFRSVWPEYFQTVGMQVLQGRTLTEDDTRDTEPVAVVNQAFVDRYWPGQDPLGKWVQHFSRQGTRHRVVGVVANVRQHGFGRQVNPEIYFTHDQLRWNMSFWIGARMRPGVEALAQADAVRRAVWSVDADVPISGLDELSHVFDESAATTRFLTVVLGAFGVLAMLLGAVGVFGVTSYTVGRRIPEFGVKMALGASRGEVLRGALLGSFPPVAAGLAAGLVASWGSSRFLESALYGIAPSDPATFTGVAALLAAVAAVASLFPAWRASRVDPVSVLNRE